MKSQYHFELQNKRKQLGLTQRQAANILDMTERNYQKYEYGDHILPRWQFLGITAALTEGAK